MNLAFLLLNDYLESVRIPEETVHREGLEHLCKESVQTEETYRSYLNTLYTDAIIMKMLEGITKNPNYKNSLSVESIKLVSVQLDREINGLVSENNPDNSEILKEANYLKRVLTH